MIKKILIGVYDSKYAEHAAKYGFSLAESLNAQVGLVNIVEPAAIPMVSNGADEILGSPMQAMNTNNVDLLEVQTEISAAILNRINNKYAGKVPVTQFHEYGSTGEGIIGCSAEFKADLIVIGTHPRSTFGRLFSGDIAEYVVRHSEVPVLVIPSKE